MFTMKRDIRNLQYCIGKQLDMIEQLKERVTELEKHNKVQFYSYKGYSGGSYPPFSFAHDETTLHRVVMSLITFLGLDIEYVKPTEGDIKFSTEVKCK
jgi:transposase